MDTSSGLCHDKNVISVPVRVRVSNFWKVSGFVAGFVVTVLCLSRRTVLHTLHARMFFSLARILHFAFEVISCLPTVAPPRL